MELLIFGGIALLSGVAGASYYTCYYKPLSEADGRNTATPTPSLENSTSVESIVKDGKVTDRDYFHLLGRSSGRKSLIINGEDGDDDGEDTSISNTMDGYEELPEHALSVVLQKTGQQQVSHTSSIRLDKPIIPSTSSHNNRKNSTLEDDEIDLEKFLKREQELEDKAFEESIKEKHPYGF